MAKFHGKTNLHLGEPVWAGSEYDHESRAYVINVDGKDADRFRKVAAGYGFVEADVVDVVDDEAEAAKGA